MRKLLSANFSRLWKDKIFLIAMTCIAIASVFFSYSNFKTSISMDQPAYVEDVMWNMFPVIAFVCVGFIAMFIGTEFDENTIRNKLIVGHTRTEIYFANYLVCMVASLLMLLAILLFSGITGYVLFKTFMLEWKQLAFLILCCILCTMVFSAIGVGIVMSVNKKASSLLVGLLLIFGLMMLASYLENSLEEGEMVYESVTITMDGVQFGDLVPNPHYVDGTARKVMEFFFDMLPTGQATQINNMSFDRCTRWPILSILSLSLVTLAGWLPFRRKDVR